MPLKLAKKSHHQVLFFNICRPQRNGDEAEERYKLLKISVLLTIIFHALLQLSSQ